MIALDTLKKISPKLIGFVAISASIPKSGESFLSFPLDWYDTYEVFV